MQNTLNRDFKALSKACEFRMGNQKELPFMPNNYASLLLNIGSPIERKVVGCTRSTQIDTGEIWASSCRSRGMSLSASNLHFYLIKISPLLTPALFGNISGYDRNSFQFLENNGIHSLIGFEMFASKLIQSSVEPDPIVAGAMNIIQESKGETKIKDVYSQLGVSKSCLEKKFTEWIGLTPKEFSKIEKLKNFVRNYRQFQDCMNLTQLTFKSGYYDQSHLIKDFRYFMDEKPGTYIRSYGL